MPPMTRTTRATNASASARNKAASAPDAGRVVMPRREDFTAAVNIDLTPEKVKRIIQAAMSGDPSEQNEYFDDALTRDGELRKAKATRLMALTGLDYEIVSASQVGRAGKIDEAFADGVADYCRETLDAIDGYDDGLRHLAEGIARGAAVCEVEWDTVAGEGGSARRPVAIHPVRFSQLRGDMIDPARIRIAVEGNCKGIPIDEQPAGKFIAHTPDPIGAVPFRGGLLLPSMVAYLSKRMASNGWQIGLELFGMPMTIAKYGDGTNQQVKDVILSLIKTMGFNRGGLFPAGTDIQLVEAKATLPGGGFPHEKLVAYIDAGYSKLWLGQTLTTQMDSAGGSQAAATVHEGVRGDIRDDDARAEGRTQREQLLRPLVLYKFGERGLAVVPHFRRIVEEPRDDAATLAKLTGVVNDLGAKVPKRVIVEELGVPLCDDENLDDPIEGRAVSVDPFGFGGGDPGAAFGTQTAERKSAANAKLHRAANSLFATLRQRRSRISALLPWMLIASLTSQAHTRDVVAAIDARIAQVEDEPGANIARAIGGLIDTLPIEDLAELQRQAVLASELRGRAEAKVRIERGTRNAERGAIRNTRRVANAAINFARLPFLEAIESLRDRLGLTPEQFERLDAQARSRAFRIAGVTNMQLLADAHRELIAALEQGETARDFRLRALAVKPPPGEVGFAERNGWTGESPWHANLVQFQNTAMAYAAGSVRQLDEAGVPAWRFINNGESCPICETEIGKVYRMSDTDRIPPLHFGCDCDHEPVFDEELGGAELNDSAREPNTALNKSREPAGGFKFDVRQYGNLEPIDLGRYPPELREAFERFAVQRGWRLA